MKRLLTILFIAFSMGLFAQTGEIKPITCKALQTPNNATFYFNPPDTTLRISMGSYGILEIAGAKRYQRKLKITTTGTSGAATFDGQNLNIPIYSGVVSDATTTTKGIIQLAGDLAGTSASPTVPELANKVQVSPSSAQAGNIWMGGTTKSNNIISTSGSNSFVARSGGDTGTYGAGVGDYPVRAFENYGWAFTIPTNSGVGQFTIGDASGSNIYFKIAESGDVTFYKNMYLNAFNGAILGINNLTTGQTVHFRFGGDVNNEIENSFGGVAKFKAYHGTEFYSNAGLVAKIGATSDKKITFYDLVGVGTRLLSASNTGQLTPIADGTNGQVLQTNGSGGYSWVNQSGGTETTTVQSLSGTTPTWDVTLGKNATITLSGTTTITLSNLVSGTSGNLTVSNPTTSYNITFAGYTIWISQAIYYSGDAVVTSGLGKIDAFSWYYDGNIVLINGQVGYK